jgi:hypothetical protein
VGVICMAMNGMLMMMAVMVKMRKNGMVGMKAP